MTDNLESNGMTLAPGVIDTIVSIAVSEVEGVASIGSPNGVNNIKALIKSRPSSAGIKTEFSEDGQLNISVHIDVYYGYVLPELADRIRTNISDALNVQVGLQVSSVDIYVDGIRFKAQ